MFSNFLPVKTHIDIAETNFRTAIRTALRCHKSGIETHLISRLK